MCSSRPILVANDSWHVAQLNFFCPTPMVSSIFENIK